MKGWNTRDTRKMITPIHSRGTECLWNGEHYHELGANGNVQTATYNGINVINAFDTSAVPFWISPTWGEEFFNLRGNDIQLCHLHFKGYIWNDDVAVLPTVTGSTCRTIIVWDNQPPDTGLSPSFKEVFQSQKGGLFPGFATRWNSPLKFGQRSRFELLYDSWVRLPPNHIGEIPPPGPSQDFFTHEATNNRLTMDFVLDLEGRNCRMRRFGPVGSVFTESESGLPLLFLVSDDPNSSLTPTWSLTYGCELYWNNNSE